MGQKNYQHIARAVFGTPWFIREAEGSVITSIVRGRLNGESLALDEITARVQAARAQQGPRAASATAGPVAIVPVYGILAPRVNLMSDMSGGTTLDQIREQMSEAIADQSIAAVIMEFDSPGGSVEGVDEHPYPEEVTEDKEDDDCYDGDDAEADDKGDPVHPRRVWFMIY